MASNSLKVAEVILYAIRNRKESRGDYYQSDFLARNDRDFGKTNFVRLDDDLRVSGSV